MMNNLHVLLFNDGAIDLDVVGAMANNLAQPLDIINEERQFVPKNENFYEVTIPLYDGGLFKEHFRMSRGAFEVLLQDITNRHPELLARSIIPVEKKLLFTVWVISKPEGFLAAGDRFGMARSTAHDIFREIIAVLCNLLPEYVQWPANHNDIEEAFRTRFRIPGVVGAIDGSHIEIKQPTDNANDYYNRNNFHSIIIQGVCDLTLKFLDVYIGVPGRVHDARVFRNSPIAAHITAMPAPVHVLGDSAYPLTTNILTPFRDNGHLNHMQRNYNTVHSSARAVIERAFGRLKGKFRRLKYLDIASPDFGTNIISAACVLHNFIIMQDGDDDEEFDPDIGFDNNYDDIDPHDAYPNREAAVQKRLQIAELLL